MEEKIHIVKKSGGKLAGLKTVPASKNNIYPTIVLVHGFKADKHEYGAFDYLAQKLALKGILVYRFDFSGCGESDGEFDDVSLSGRVSELQLILDFVNSQNEVDKQKLGILGFSMGTSTILKLKPKVKAMILVSAICNLFEVFKNYYGSSFNPASLSVKNHSDRTISRKKPEFWTDLKQEGLKEDIRQINAPILFIQGTADDITPLSETEELYKVANDPKEKVIIDGGEHGSGLPHDAVFSAVLSWLNKHLI